MTKEKTSSPYRLSCLFNSRLSDTLPRHTGRDIGTTAAVTCGLLKYEDKDKIKSKLGTQGYPPNK